MRIPKRILKLRTPTGFDELFEQEISRHRTHKEAFQVLNDEFEEAFGEPRYTSYDSYRISRSKRIKK